MFGLVSQIRRAASWVPANIAEGYGRESTNSYTHFLKIARGSLKELETHVLLAQRVDMLHASRAETLLAKSDQVSRMLNALIKAVQSKRVVDDGQ